MLVAKQITARNETLPQLQKQQTQMKALTCSLTFTKESPANQADPSVTYGFERTHFDLQKNICSQRWGAWWLHWNRCFCAELLGLRAFISSFSSTKSTQVVFIICPMHSLLAQCVGSEHSPHHSHPPGIRQAHFQLIYWYLIIKCQVITQPWWVGVQ